jgi:hypothetical protein
MVSIDRFTKNDEPPIRGSLFFFCLIVVILSMERKDSTQTAIYVCILLVVDGERFFQVIGCPNLPNQ